MIFLRIYEIRNVIILSIEIFQNLLKNMFNFVGSLIFYVSFEITELCEDLCRVCGGGTRMRSRVVYRWNSLGLVGDQVEALKLAWVPLGVLWFLVVAGGRQFSFSGESNTCFLLSFRVNMCPSIVTSSVLFSWTFCEISFLNVCCCIYRL